MLQMPRNNGEIRLNYILNPGSDFKKPSLRVSSARDRFEVVFRGVGARIVILDLEYAPAP